MEPSASAYQTQALPLSHTPAHPPGFSHSLEPTIHRGHTACVLIMTAGPPAVEVLQGWWLQGGRVSADPGNEAAGNVFLMPDQPKSHPIILPASTFSHWALGTTEGQVEATHIIEHFVQFLGVHDEVGVAYHIVDGIRLDRRDTKEVRAQQHWPSWPQLRAWAEGRQGWVPPS